MCLKQISNKNIKQFKERTSEFSENLQKSFFIVIISNIFTKFMSTCKSILQIPLLKEKVEEKTGKFYHYYPKN